MLYLQNSNYLQIIRINIKKFKQEYQNKKFHLIITNLNKIIQYFRSVFLRKTNNKNLTLILKANMNKSKNKVILFQIILFMKYLQIKI